MAETVATPGLVPITILNQAEYFDDLHQAIEQTKAGDKVSMVVMGFEPRDKETTRITNALHRAADGGAQVQFGVDAYTFMVTDGETYLPGPLVVPLPFGQSAFKQRRAAYDTLAAHSSVRAGILNIPSRKFSNPFAGRSHIKVSVVNDMVYIAGPNLYVLEGRDDMVLALQDADVASRLHATIGQMIAANSVVQLFGGADQVIPVDTQTDLLVDAGAPSQSIIMDRALAAIDRAQEFAVVGSQFFPTANVTGRLREAHRRGARVRIVRNSPAYDKTLKKWTELGALVINRMQLPRCFFDDTVAKGLPTSHAAVLLTENEVIKGSHNFHAAGVRFGTAELVLHRRGDPTLSKAIARQLFRQTGLDFPG